MYFYTYIHIHINFISVPYPNVVRISRGKNVQHPLLKLRLKFFFLLHLHILYVCRKI